jgi:hypothetical protein
VSPEAAACSSSTRRSALSIGFRSLMDLRYTYYELSFQTIHG